MGCDGIKRKRGGIGEDVEEGVRVGIMVEEGRVVRVM